MNNQIKKSIIEEKKLLRLEVLKTRRSLSKEFVNNSSKIVIEKLIELKEYKNSSFIASYVSFENEIVTRELINHSLNIGKKVLVPIIINKDIYLSQIESLTDLQPRTLGILEPKEDKLNLIDPKLVDLYILTGLAFDRTGNRLGFGAGYNDKAIKKLSSSCKKIALTYDFNVFKSIPITPYDEKVDLIISEKENININLYK